MTSQDWNRLMHLGVFFDDTIETLYSDILIFPWNTKTAHTPSWCMGVFFWVRLLFVSVDSTIKGHFSGASFCGKK